MGENDNLSRTMRILPEDQMGLIWRPEAGLRHRTGDDVREWLTARGRCGAPPDGAELVMSGRFLPLAHFSRILNALEARLTAGLDLTSPILLD